MLRQFALLVSNVAFLWNPSFLSWGSFFVLSLALSKGEGDETGSCWWSNSNRKIKAKLIGKNTKVFYQ
jgi:hypothetical protein